MTHVRPSPTRTTGFPPPTRRPRPRSPPPLPPSRLASIDAYRGLVMFLMMAEVLNLRDVAAKVHGQRRSGSSCAITSRTWSGSGCSLHDLIQPSFSFLVGVALPFSMAGRLARGQSKAGMTAHALWRALLLVALGIFLRSRNGSQTNFTFEDTLSQIGLGYPFLFLLGVLLGAGAVDRAGVDPHRLLGGVRAVSAPGLRLRLRRGRRARRAGRTSSGFAAHWDKNSNLAWAFDTWFLNLFPREQAVHRQRRRLRDAELHPDAGHDDPGPAGRRGPAAARAGLGEGRSGSIVAGVIGLAAGWGLGELGVCPVVKRIWTPSWVLFSGGWCFLFLAGFYAVLDLLGVRFWAFPLRVIGMNSIAAYCMAGLFEDFIEKNLTTHLGHEPFQVLGEPYEPLLHGAAVLLVLWLILFWMYRRKIFLRI